LTINPMLHLGAAAVALTGRSEFDGYRNSFPFDHTDTLDSSRNRLTAGRLWADFGSDRSDWSGHLGAALLGSSNRNYLAEDPINRTQGTRRTIDAQLERRFSTGSLEQQVILAAEAERETFHA